MHVYTERHVQVSRTPCTRGTPGWAASPHVPRAGNVWTAAREKKTHMVMKWNVVKIEYIGMKKTFQYGV